MKLKNKFVLGVLLYLIVGSTTSFLIIHKMTILNNIHEITSHGDDFIQSLYVRRENIQKRLLSYDYQEIIKFDKNSMQHFLIKDDNILSYLSKIYNCEQKLLKIYKEKREFEQIFKKQYVQEKKYRHLLQNALFDSKNPQLIKKIASIMYKSKESIFQYRDEKHFKEWIDSIKRLEEITDGSVKNYSITYYDTAIVIWKTVLKIKELELDIEKLYSDYQNSLLNIDNYLDSNKKDQDIRFNKLTKIAILDAKILLFVCFFITFLIFFYLRNKVLSPLTNFIQVTNDFKGINKGHRVNISSNDEIGELASSFNNMISIIGELHDEMEFKISERTKDLEELKNKYKKLASIDDLTQLSNRRMIIKILQTELEISKRYGDYLSVIIIDIDKFKNINDKYGHLAGDEILIAISDIINNTSRETDSVGRWGGEEFIVICPKTEMTNAELLAERIRLNVADFNYDSVGSCTISLGVTSFKEDADIESLISRADEALYLAKSSGRNNVKTKI